MRSESARRILAKTPQEVKDKVIAYADEVARKSKLTNTMTKIEELEECHKYWLDVPGKWQWRFERESLESYKAAIREQVVLDALPSEKEVKRWIKLLANEGEERMNRDISVFFSNLTTREEVERPFVELLKECKLQLEYLNKKFKPTGTSNAIIERINSLTDGK